MEEPARISRLADRIGLDISTTSRKVAELEAAGLVVRGRTTRATAGPRSSRPPRRATTWSAACGMRAAARSARCWPAGRIPTGPAWPTCSSGSWTTSTARVASVAEHPGRAARDEGLQPPPDHGDHERADAGHAPGRARPDDRGHGAPDHRRRPRRTEPPLVGRDRLPGRLDGDHAALRQVQRHLRPQAHVPVCDRGVPVRIGARRPLAEHDRADRVPRPPGHRRRWADDARDDDHRRRRPAPPARPLPGLHGRRVRARKRHRPAPRRLLRRPAVVAVGVLREPARRRRGAGRHEHRARPALHARWCTASTTPAPPCS